MKIRQEINITDRISGYSYGSTDPSEIVWIDTTKYSNASYYFEIVTGNTGLSGDVRLRRTDDNTQVASISLISSDDYQRFRTTSFTPTAGSYGYCLHTFSGCELACARIVIIQNATDIIATETQYEIGTYEVNIANASPAIPCSYPKYWKYESGNYDGTVAFTASVTYSTNKLGFEVTIVLQEASSPSGSWSDKVTIVSAGTAELDTLVSVSFTPTNGYYYRIAHYAESTMYTYNIFNAKVNVQQLPETFYSQPDSYTPDYLYGGTGSSSEANQMLGIRLPATTDAITLYYFEANFYKTGTPTDNVVAKIATSIGGTPLATSDTVSGSDIGTSPADIRFNFSSRPTMSGSTTYYVWLERSGARDTSNYYRWQYNDTGAGYRGYHRDNLSWSQYASEHYFRCRLYAGDTPTLFRPEYLLINSNKASTGLTNCDTYFDPAEWDGVTDAFYHEIDSDSDSSNSAKLQQDPNGSPADITNSTATGAYNARSSEMTMPGTAQTIDTYILNTPIYASRIIAVIEKEADTNLSANINDSVTITDAIQGNPTPLRINVFDGVTVTDEKTVLKKQIFVPLLSDAVTISEESTVYLKQIFVSQSDAITINDTSSTLLANFHVTVDETISIDDTMASYLPALYVSVDDTIGVSDHTESYLNQLHISTYDDVTVEDDSQAEKFTASRDIAVDDSVTVMDAVEAFIFNNLSISVDDTLTIDDSPEVSILISGSVCWGHSTDVTETNILSFAGNWTGTGTISGSGDSEVLELSPAEYLISQIVNTGVVGIDLHQNKYNTGDTGVLQYRHGNSPSACQGASWQDYSELFISDGYLQLKVSN